MALSNAGKAVALNALGAAGLWASLHSGDPGTTGAAELAGGSPAYARQPVTWDAASGGLISLTGTEVFDVPAGSVGFFGVWSASSGGTFYGGGALSAVEVYAAQGEYELTDATIALT